MNPKEEQCRRYVKNLSRAMGFAGWTLDVEFKRLEEDTYAENLVFPEYRRATLTFDLEQGYDELLDTIRHELLHLTHCNFELYRKAVGGIVAPPQWSIFESIYENCVEDTVARIEEMLDKLGHTSESIEEKGRRE